MEEGGPLTSGVLGGVERSSTNELREQLVSVFVRLFGLSPADIHGALAPEEVPRWDSIGHVSLVATIEDELQLALEIDEIMEMTSFDVILNTLEKKLLDTGRS